MDCCISQRSPGKERVRRKGRDGERGRGKGKCGKAERRRENRVLFRDSYHAIMVADTSSHSHMLPAKPDSQESEGCDSFQVQGLEDQGSPWCNLRPKGGGLRTRDV